MCYIYSFTTLRHNPETVNYSPIFNTFLALFERHFNLKQASFSFLTSVIEFIRLHPPIFGLSLLKATNSVYSVASYISLQPVLSYCYCSSFSLLYKALQNKLETFLSCILQVIWFITQSNFRNMS